MSVNTNTQKHINQNINKGLSKILSLLSPKLRNPLRHKALRDFKTVMKRPLSSRNLGKTFSSV